MAHRAAATFRTTVIALPPVANNGTARRVRDADKALPVGEPRFNLVTTGLCKRARQVRQANLIVKADVPTKQHVTNLKIDALRPRLVPQARRQAAIGLRVGDTPAVHESQQDVAICHTFTPSSRPRRELPRLVLVCFDINR